MAVPNIFGSATSAIPLSQLDQNFATAITLGNTAVYLGNTTTSLGNVTLTNVTISSGNVSVSTATVGAGSNTAPSITTTGDTNTGIFFPAADTIAFSEGGVEAMRIDASGRLGVATTGTSVPAAYQNTNGYIQNGRSGWAYVVDDSANTHIVHNVIYNGTNNTYAGSGYASRMSIIDADGSFRWYQAGSGTAGNTASLSERARITSGGDLLVGTTSSFTARLSVKDGTSNGTTNAIYCKNSADTALFYISSNGYFVTGTGANSPYNLTTASGSNVTIESDGVLKRSTSSLKYKTDVQNATHGLAEVLQLRPVTYKGKNDGNKVFGGLIAEEVDAAGLTEFVQYAEDGSPDALAYGNMVSLLTKAIQEQQAIITQLQADVAALKGTA